MALQRFSPLGLFNGNLPVLSYFDSLVKARVQINPKLCCFEERRRLGLVTAGQGGGGQVHRGSASRAAGVPAGPALAGGNARAPGVGSCRKVAANLHPPAPTSNTWGMCSD